MHSPVLGLWWWRRLCWRPRWAAELHQKNLLWGRIHLCKWTVYHAIIQVTCDSHISLLGRMFTGPSVHDTIRENVGNIWNPGLKKCFNMQHINTPYWYSYLCDLWMMWPKKTLGFMKVIIWPSTHRVVGKWMGQVDTCLLVFRLWLGYKNFFFLCFLLWEK